MKKRFIAVAALTVVAACSSNSGTTRKEQNVANDQLNAFLTNQPVPIFQFSQLRQNLIELERAQAESVATTSFMFNQGVVDPVSSCPSIGFPIPSTTQLSNPQKAVGGGNGVTSVGNLEATGVYTGNSSGTYVVCVTSGGKAYALYWEGFVETITGPATWDATKKQVVLTGDPTGAFTVKGK